jgi:DNA polymerase III epsilon subunit-like protein
MTEPTLENATSPREALESFDYWSQMYRDVKRTGKKSGKVFYNLRTAGHNIDSFDIPFLRALYKAHDKFCTLDYMETFDTLKLSKWLFALWYPEYPLENNKLETLCKAYGIPLDNAHDALADIQANARLAYGMRYCKPITQED